MAVAKTKAKTITYQAYLKMPEINKRYDIIDGETVEVARLSRQGMEVLNTFGMGETLRSEVLPDLSVSVNEIFA